LTSSEKEAKEQIRDALDLNNTLRNSHGNNPNPGNARSKNKISPTETMEKLELKSIR
jgi:hypothetical protein